MKIDASMLVGNPVNAIEQGGRWKQPATARKLLERYGDIAQRISPVGYTADKEVAKAMAVAMKKALA